MGFQEKLSETAEKIASFESPSIFCHIDADGLTSGSILFHTLSELGKTPQIFPLRQLDLETRSLIPTETPFILVDFGSGQANLLSGNKNPGAIIDHHEPSKDPLPPQITHLNAIEQGFSGSKEISAAGLAYLVSEKLLPKAAGKLAPLAITGAVGDVQARRGLTGLNRTILEAGVRSGSVVAAKGLPFFGRETRELAAFLSYATDPFLPGLTGNIPSCEDFLKTAGIPPTSTYNRLSPGELSKLITALHEHAIQTGLEPWQIRDLITEFYTFPDEEKGTEPRDATEFSTLLNSCGRNNWAGTGIEICLGNRADSYSKAKTLLAQHRENIRNGLQELAETGVRSYGRNLQVFSARKIKPTIIGIVIGIALGGRLVDTSRVFIGTAPQDSRSLKISARTTSWLVRAGIRLSDAARSAAKAVDGIGGGHDIAAGASIPENRLEEFLALFDRELSTQRTAGAGGESRPKTFSTSPDSPFEENGDN